ncbi:MAG: hypothetical protein CMI09_01735 [Oceanospirillaceae bacterium]|nr:hypothetical protein [Oceanospirillaceae bacterium]
MSEYDDFKNQKDLDEALEQIVITIDKEGFKDIKLLRNVKEGFNQFKDTPTFKDKTFSDGGQWLSSFSDLKAGEGVLNDPKIKEAIKNLSNFLKEGND